jgi:N,N-dimethylformamidase beta subunit-like, C-terminal
VTATLLTALVPVAAILAGCGGGGAPVHTATTTSGAPARPHGVPAAYRWLVRTRGPQPSIAAENRARGTRAWRLPGPAAELGGVASGAVAGYVAAPAVAPGDVQRVYVSAPGSRSVTIRIFRIGWYAGTGGSEVLSSRPLRVVRQPACAHSFRTGLTECRWHPTLSFKIPSALATGVYIVRLTTRSGARDAIFVVRSTRAQPLLAQLPTSTYEAYNAWGGDSLYPGGDRVAITHSTQGVEVSYDRPYETITGAGEFFSRDVALVWFLERYRYPVSYTSSESADVDPGQLRGHRALIDFGHSEYWSARQAAAFTRARDHGTSLLFLSSDTMAWKVRYERASHRASQAGRPGQTIVAYKEYAARDPDRRSPSGRFPDGGAALTGSRYLGCITPRLASPGPPVYLYYTWSPSPALRPRWLFAHTGITATTQIPGIVGYELDMLVPASPHGTAVIGSGAAACMAPEHGEPAPGLGERQGQTTLYTAPSGALVFSAGMLGWELGLEPVPSASPDAPRTPEPRLVAITRNLLARVLRPIAQARGR